MCIEDELDALRTDCESLTARPATIDDWRRIDARAYLLLLSGQMQLAALQRTLPSRLRACVVRDFIDALDEIRVLRTCAQRRVCELETPPVISAG